MNVGHPSNLSRIIAIYGGIMDEKGAIIKEPDMERMCRDLFGVSVSNEGTRESIAEAYKKYKTILEPHGAIAWRGINEYLKSRKPGNQLFISLETAHPAKFPEELQRILKISPPLPTSMEMLEEKEENYMTIENNYRKLKEFILQDS
jgi:threonine synthase